MVEWLSLVLVAQDTTQSLDASMWVEAHLPDILTSDIAWLDRGTFTHVLTHKKLRIRVLSV